MARGASQAVACHDGVEAMAVMLRIERTRQLDGAQHLRLERAPDAEKLMLEKADVEAGVVGDE